MLTAYMSNVFKAWHQIRDWWLHHNRYSLSTVYMIYLVNNAEKLFLFQKEKREKNGFLVRLMEDLKTKPRSCFGPSKQTVFFFSHFSSPRKRLVNVLFTMNNRINPTLGSYLYIKICLLGHAHPNLSGTGT